MPPAPVHDELIRTRRIPAPPGLYMDHVNVTLLGPSPLALLDSAYAETTVTLLEWLREAAPEGLDTLILTHFHRDHLGGAAAVCEATGARACAHPIEIPLMKERQPSLVLEPVEEGTKLRFGKMEVEALLTPGHSPGHLSFWWAEERVLFGGDNVLLPTTTSISPPLGCLSDYLRTLQRILALEPRVIYPGHGSPVRDPGGRIRALLAHRAQREEQVLAALAKGPETPAGIAEDIYRGLGEARIRMGTSMVRSHLEKLAEEGKVRDEEGRFRIVE
ncbi:MAG: MBL fold metallo-hydrolase [Candidatus Tectomicrobia bacterium]|nr:MBL fold metallo-hydrolase [Candidatus Tectomicrobia bacterium]